MGAIVYIGPKCLHRSKLFTWAQLFTWARIVYIGQNFSDEIP